MKWSVATSTAGTPRRRRASRRRGNGVTLASSRIERIASAFFEAIDIFAFPSLYPTETQGIVNLEALACGKPVVAFAQCCIRSDIGDLGGLAVEVGEDYAEQLASFCKTFMENRKMRSKNARLRFEQLTEIYKYEVALITTTVLERLRKSPIG